MPLFFVFISLESTLTARTIVTFFTDINLYLPFIVAFSLGLIQYVILNSMRLVQFFKMNILTVKFPLDKPFVR